MKLDIAKKQVQQFSPFEVIEKQTEFWKYAKYNLDSFEIMWIVNGSGFQTFNKVDYPYKTNDFFLIIPRENTHFTITKKTTFCCFKFTQQLGKHNEKIQNHARWTQKIESILYNPRRKQGPISFRDNDKEHAIQLCKLMLYESKHAMCNYDEVLADSMSALMNILSRNICGGACMDEHRNVVGYDVQAMLGYIRQHIFDGGRLQVNAMAEHFNMSKNYVSIYFKRHTGKSLQQYVIDYKLSLAETKIIHSKYTITEIAYQLGFTDESHLSRLFKKKYGLNPSVIRKQNSLV